MYSGMSRVVLGQPVAILDIPPPHHEIHNRMVQRWLFLDTTVKIVDGRIVTDLYVKPTDTHNTQLPTAATSKHSL